MSKTYEACMKCGDVFFPAVSRHPLCCDCAVAEIARLEAKNAELKTAIASHNTRMDAVPSINRPISAVVGLRFLAEWFDKVYDDAKYGDDKVQQDCRKWATEIEATERELAEKQAVVEKLPKTADGVRVSLGDEVWYPLDFYSDKTPAATSCAVVMSDEGCSKWAVQAWLPGRNKAFTTMKMLAVSDCYSTREAAAAARAGKGERRT